MAIHVSNEKFIEIWWGASSISDIARGVGFNSSGATSKLVKRRMEQLGLDDKHLSDWRHMPKKRWTMEEAFTEKSLCSNGTLKKLILENELMEYRCAGIDEQECPNAGLTEWLGHPLKFQLDHITGNRYDCRLENLRFLCGTCHYYTETFGSKNKFRNVKLEFEKRA